ncbi:MAG TPA: preprotein translocase subunit SecE [Luteibaculaceae bacterium]|nr:preprotein translocase subunit SecE [Luteibaculaceae bacterium]
MAGFKTFLAETYDELVNHVSWPTWKELQSSSLLVLVATGIFALVVFLMDVVFGINGEGGIFGWQGILGWVYQILGDL